MKFLITLFLSLALNTFLHAQDFHRVLDTTFTSEPVSAYFLPNGNLRVFYVRKHHWQIRQLAFTDYAADGKQIRSRDLIYNPAKFVGGTPPTIYPMRDGSAIVATYNDDCDSATPGSRILVDTSGQMKQNYGYGNTLAQLFYGYYLTQIKKDTVALYHHDEPQYYPMVISTGKWQNLVADPVRQLPPLISYQNSWYTARGSTIYHYDENDQLLRSESMPGSIKQIIQLSTSDLILKTADYYLRVDTQFILRQVVPVVDSNAEMVALSDGNWLINPYVGTDVPVFNQFLEIVDTIAVDQSIRFRQILAKGSQLYILGETQANRSRVAFLSIQPATQSRISFSEMVALDGVQLLDGIKIIPDTTVTGIPGLRRSVEFGDILITIRNTGHENLDSVSFCYTARGCSPYCPDGPEIVYPIKDLNIQPNQTRQVVIKSLKTVCTSDSLNQLCFWLRSPNGKIDSNRVNNELCINQILYVQNQEIADTHGIRVYPNPAEDWIKITGLENASHEIEYKLTDMLGRIWRTGSLTASMTIDQLNQIPLGVYHLSLQYAGVAVSRQVVLARN